MSIFIYFHKYRKSIFYGDSSTWSRFFTEALNSWSEDSFRESETSLPRGASWSLLYQSMILAPSWSAFAYGFVVKIGFAMLTSPIITKLIAMGDPSNNRILKLALSAIHSSGLLSTFAMIGYLSVYYSIAIITTSSLITATFYGVLSFLTTLIQLAITPIFNLYVGSTEPSKFEYAAKIAIPLIITGSIALVCGYAIPFITLTVASLLPVLPAIVDTCVSWALEFIREDEVVQNVI